MASIGAHPLPPTATAAAADSQRPSAHTQRYDRQLRLWASSGQTSLEKANVLVIGACALSGQILKNLVLPGIGSFTLVDDAVVHPADLGVNFFLQPGESESSYAASEMVRLLLEMNDSVKAETIIQSPAALLRSSPQRLAEFTLIISVNQPRSFDEALSEFLWGLEPPSPQVPLLRAQSAGTMGELSISVKELGIIETHPDSIIDLRLTRPFPQLLELADKFDLGTSDTMEHSHIAFPFILLKKLSEWQQKNGGNLPTSRDRDAFIKSINAARMKGNPDAENFEEAIAALGKHVWRPVASNGVGGGGVPHDVEAMFKDACCQHVTSTSTNFWILIRTLSDFVTASETGSLPLSGSVPDMKATSAAYVQLQNVYRAKALQDLAQFKTFLAAVCRHAGIEGRIPDDEVEAFVKHAGFLKLVRGRSERQKAHHPSKEAAMLAFMDPVNPSTFEHHIALAAGNEFFEQYGRYPGSSSDFSSSLTSSAVRSPYSIPALQQKAAVSSGTREPAAKRQKSATPTGESDSNGSHPVMDVKMDDTLTGYAEDGSMTIAIAKQIAASRFDITVDSDDWDKIEASVLELVRSGYASLPATTSLMGGVVAQEAIKLITKQYVPADNTVIYDGIRQAIGVFRL